MVIQELIDSFPGVCPSSPTSLLQPPERYIQELRISVPIAFSSCPHPNPASLTSPWPAMMHPADLEMDQGVATQAESWSAFARAQYDSVLLVALGTHPRAGVIVPSCLIGTRAPREPLRLLFGDLSSEWRKAVPNVRQSWPSRLERILSYHRRMSCSTHQDDPPRVLRPFFQGFSFDVACALQYGTEIE